MRSYPLAFATELAAEPGHRRLVRLLEIETETPIYRCSWNQEVVFTPDGASAARTYIPDKFSFGEISGSILDRIESPALELRLQNVTDPVTGAARHWATLMGTTNLNGVTVNIRLVSLDLLADGEAQAPEENWRISGPGLDGNDCVLQLGPPHDVFALEVTRQQIKCALCEYEFKDRFCKSESTLTSCAYNLADCLRRQPSQKVRISQLPIHDQSLRRVS